MEIIRAGHEYALKDFESGEHIQELAFINKKPKEEGSTELVTVHPGTTNEDVLEVLINRCEYLYRKFPSNETKQAILHMKLALENLESRTKNRVKRGVEGKYLK